MSFLKPTTCMVVNIVAGFAFLAGSTCFLPALADYAVTGVYLFMLGSLLWIVTSTADYLRIKRRT